MNKPARNSSEVFNEDRSRQVSWLSNKVFGRDPKRVAFPGGTSRSAFVADMDEEAPFVFAKRENREDAQLEGIILRTLGSTGYVPKLKAVVDNWVVQECIPGTRLPVLLDETEDMDAREKLVAASLESLVNIHTAAHKTNLHHRACRRWGPKTNGFGTGQVLQSGYPNTFPLSLPNWIVKNWCT